jgi:toxin ParE1/3/4
VTQYRVERGRQALLDLDQIYDFLFESYLSFGDSRADAVTRVERRMEAITAQMLQLGDVPHQGTLCDDLAPGLRSVTKDRAIFYFSVDEEKRVVRVLAAFFGGQDHQRAMLTRTKPE